MDVDCSLFDEGAGNEESGKDIRTETWIEWIEMAHKGFSGQTLLL
jgi:hypothetical protein